MFAVVSEPQATIPNFHLRARPERARIPVLLRAIADPTLPLSLPDRIHHGVRLRAQRWSVFTLPLTHHIPLQQHAECMIRHIRIDSNPYRPISMLPLLARGSRLLRSQHRRR